MPDLAGRKIAYLTFCGLIDPAGVGKVTATLNVAVNEQFDEVYLCFSSNGGYVGDGIFLYNHIKALPIPVTIHNTGTVASIATTLFTAGLTRYCSKHSVFMMHPIGVPGSGNLATPLLEASLASAQADEARTETILRANTKISEEILMARRARDIYLTPDQALDFGLVHGITEFRLPPGNKIFNV